jgi:hypothetical protein
MKFAAAILAGLTLSTQASFALTSIYSSPKNQTANVQAQSMAALGEVLGRNLTDSELQMIDTAKSQVDAIRSQPQKAATLFGWEVHALACGSAQGNLFISKGNGMLCVDLTNEIGTRFVLGGAQFSTSLVGAEAGPSVVFYAGKPNMKPFIGNYAVRGGGVSFPIPFFQLGPDAKLATNLDGQIIAIAGGSVGLKGNPNPVRLHYGALTVQKFDWLGWAHGESKY